MPWENSDPASVAFGSAAAYLGGQQDAKNRKRKETGEDEDRRQQAIAFAATQADNKAAGARADRGLAIQESDLGLRTTAAADTSAAAALDLKVRKAQFALDQALQPLQVQAATLSVALQRGQLTAQKYQTEATALANKMTKHQYDIAKQFDVPRERLALAQGQAGIASTQAGTAATQFSTQRGQALLPGEIQGQDLNNVGRAIGNFGGQIGNARDLRDLNTAPASRFTVDPKDPSAKLVADNVSKATSAYQSRLNTWLKGDGDGATQQPDGTWQTDSGTKFGEKPPEDFETYSDALSTLMQQVSKDPKSLKKTLAAIDADKDGMTAAQKSYAKRRLTEAAKPQPSGGLSGQGSAPFGTFSSLVAGASREFAIPPQILRAVGMQESGGGAGLTPSGGSPDPTNAGHGIFQLSPSSGAPPDVLARAAKDPAFATRVAANQLRGLYQQYGSWPAALAAYNAGSPDSAKGQQYAAQVLGRVQ